MCKYVPVLRWDQKYQRVTRSCEMVSCYLNVASYRFWYLQSTVCILPVAQHEVRELIAGPKYGTHETCLNFNNNSVITFPMQSCTLSPK